MEKLVGTPRDGAMLRLSLARLLAEAERLQDAEAHLRKAVEMQADYTAAWKELGKIRQRRDDTEGAKAAWRNGIEAAVRNGDKQAEREMAVFLRRLERAARS